MTILAATRASALARAQASQIAQELTRAGHPTELTFVTSQGDTDRSSLAQIGGQGVFTAAISAAVLDGKARFAIHSLKDLPTTPTAGLAVVATPPRADPRDVLVTRGAPDALPAGARVGTGSLRRRAQLKAWRDDLVAEDLRGNIDTRLDRVRTGDLDAVMLAAAGLDRLQPDLEGLVITPLDEDRMTPAVGQGALALECREDDASMREILQSIGDPETWAAVTLERALLARLQGGCQVPFAAHAADGKIRLVIADPEGSGCWRRKGPIDKAERLFEELCQDGDEVIRRYFKT